MNDVQPGDDVAAKTSGQAIASLVCAICSFCTGFLLGIPAVILGHISQSKIKKSGGVLQGSGMALAGVIIGYITTAGSLLLLPGILVGFSKGITESARETACMAKIMEISSKLETYNLLSGGYPSTQEGLNALIEKPLTYPEGKTWKQQFTELPKDPWGAPYQYVFSGAAQPETFEVISQGADGELGTVDDISSKEAP